MSTVGRMRRVLISCSVPVLRRPSPHCCRAVVDGGVSHDRTTERSAARSGSNGGNLDALAAMRPPARWPAGILYCAASLSDTWISAQDHPTRSATSDTGVRSSLRRRASGIRGIGPKLPKRYLSGETSRRARRCAAHAYFPGAICLRRRLDYSQKLFLLRAGDLVFVQRRGHVLHVCRPLGAGDR